MPFICFSTQCLTSMPLSKVLMQTRDEWRRLAEKTNNSNAWSTYRLLKCEVRCELREAEKELLRNK